MWRVLWRLMPNVTFVAIVALASHWPAAARRACATAMIAFGAAGLGAVAGAGLGAPDQSVALEACHSQVASMAKARSSIRMYYE